MIGIGIGLYSALSGTATWRYQSNDASFDATGMYDLRVKSTEGLDTKQGEMLAVLASLPDPTVVTNAEERMVFDTQVDASTDAESIRVPGRIVGLDVSAGGPELTSVAVEDGSGRTLTTADDGLPVAVLERNFADYYDLPPNGTVRLGGGVTLGCRHRDGTRVLLHHHRGRWVLRPGELRGAVHPLTTAQEIAGRPGKVNDLVSPCVTTPTSRRCGRRCRRRSTRPTLGWA